MQKATDNNDGFMSGQLKWLQEAMIEYAKEAIEECAEIPALKFGDVRAINIKQSILSLINELK